MPACLGGGQQGGGLAQGDLRRCLLPGPDGVAEVFGHDRVGEQAEHLGDIVGGSGHQFTPLSVRSTVRTALVSFLVTRLRLPAAYWIALCSWDHPNPRVRRSLMS